MRGQISGLAAIRNLLSMVLAVLLLAGLSAGCSQNQTAPLAPQPLPPIMDVPIPAGFQLERGQSQATVVPHSPLRLINQVYEGPASRHVVERFYLQHMPAMGWKILEQTRAPHALILFFNKHRENCTITIKREWFRTRLYVVIAPAGSIN